MAKAKGRKDISPGKKPGPLTKKERKERKKKRKEKHPKWLFLHLFTVLKIQGWIFKEKDERWQVPWQHDTFIYLNYIRI